MEIIFVVIIFKVWKKPQLKTICRIASKESVILQRHSIFTVVIIFILNKSAFIIDASIIFPWWSSCRTLYFLSWTWLVPFGYLPCHCQWNLSLNPSQQTQQFLFNLENELIELFKKDISLQKSFSKLFVAFKGFTYETVDGNHFLPSFSHVFPAFLLSVYYLLLINFFAACILDYKIFLPQSDMLMRKEDIINVGSKIKSHAMRFQERAKVIEKDVEAQVASHHVKLGNPFCLMT